MTYLVKERKLELKYVPGKGAWTYHIEIPGTKQLKGKWGEMKVSGSIDGYPIENLNLAPIKGKDKIISINSKIRKAINKIGGDLVTVTLFTVGAAEQIDKERILLSFEDGGILRKFEQLSKADQDMIINNILSGESQDKQIQLIVKYIDKLG